MLIKIISIGNKLNSWESECIEYYKKQLPRNFKIEFINLKSQQNPKYSKDEVIMNESKLLMSKISKDPNIDNIYQNISKNEKTEFINNIELPKEWIEKISLSGETYWYNSETKERTYVLPKKKIIQTLTKL